VALSTLKSPRKPKGSGHLRRSEILEAAQRIFYEFGYEGATVRKIAEQVGVSSTAIYLHFPDKRAMLTEIAAEAIGMLLAEAQQIAVQPVDAKERARRILQAYVRFALDHQSAYMVVFSDAQREISKGEDVALSVFRAYFLVFVGILTELAKAGRLHGVRPNLVGMTMWAGCHGVSTLLITRHRFEAATAEELCDTTIDTLLAGAIS
jgi:AcrR family transcriptional regulator